jgi:hypothetical protein
LTVKRSNVLHFCTEGVDVDGFRPDKDHHDLDSRAERLPAAHHATIRLASTDGEQCDELACTGSKIFAFYPGRGTMVYDSEAGTVGIGPPLVAPKHEFLAVGHDIYALETFLTDSPSMEKLGPAPRRGYGEWRWENLPPPPLKLAGYISSHVVHPNGSAFFLSFSGMGSGTFSFDTGSLAWTRLGGWHLPFIGKAYFVRELDAWVGLCPRNRGYISVCEVISPDGRRTDPPVCTTARERVYCNNRERHLCASFTYMGNAEFCLLETVTREGYDIYTDDNTPKRMLLRLVTFRVERRRNRELRAVNMGTKVYNWPHRETQYRPAAAFWISQISTYY